MVIDMHAIVQQANARYADRLAKHRCVRCGDQLTDGHKPVVCATCQPYGGDYAADRAADDPRRGQAEGLNALRRIP